MGRFDELAGLTESKGDAISAEAGGRLRAVFEGIIKQVARQRKHVSGAKQKKREPAFWAGLSKGHNDQIESSAKTGLKIVKGLKIL